ncbi:protein E6-like [Phragmites australis]|uniref:protein E6-like n=1 Tax=Phragmites australis TaxID=29695 RepID=UPI002D79928B|nr:protein E6-like [Phragmites australis]
MASSAHHLFLLAFLAVLAVAAPRASDAWGGGHLFSSKITRAEVAVEPEKAAAATTVPDAADPNSVPAFSRPSTSGSSRGYGLYGRPEENYPPAYFRRGVHHNTEKLTTTTNVPTTTDTEEAAVPVGGERAEPFPENGSGRGRPPYYYTGFRGGRQQEQQRDYGMSDTRLYQNGRYYYDVDNGRYGYGRESNPVRTRPDEFGSGYGGGGGGDRRGRYGNAAGYESGSGNGNEFGNALTENQYGFQEQGQNGQYVP